MTKQFYIFAFVGFVAQLVKGSVGMGFGVISSAALLTLGLPPAFVSSSVHTAEVGTTGATALSHTLFKNIDYVLFRRLVIPGVIGSVIGAYILSQLPIDIARPAIAIYLLLMGCVILYKTLRKVIPSKSIRAMFSKYTPHPHEPTHAHQKGVLPLAFVGGFLDAAGGSGWGHIITSTLLARNVAPHYAIGTVNTAQFFIAVSVAITFFITVGASYWPIVLALLAGGVVAAPIAAYMVRRIHPYLLMLLASISIVFLSSSTLIKLFLQ